MPSIAVSKSSFKENYNLYTLMQSVQMICPFATPKVDFLEAIFASIVRNRDENVQQPMVSQHLTQGQIWRQISRLRNMPALPSNTSVKKWMQPKATITKKWKRDVQPCNTEKKNNLLRKPARLCIEKKKKSIKHWRQQPELVYCCREETLWNTVKDAINVHTHTGTVTCSVK